MDHFQLAIEKNRIWAGAKLAQDANFFGHLSEGQAPHFLYIGCSDSRVVPEHIFGARPGEIFVHRNIANQVRRDDPATDSVLYFALMVLKVEHIMVCGHYGCGGVKASMVQEVPRMMQEWLEPIKGLHLSSEDISFRRLVEENTLQQCRNLLEHPVMTEVKKAGLSPRIHACVYDMESGLVKELELE